MTMTLKQYRTNNGIVLRKLADALPSKPSYSFLAKIERGEGFPSPDLALEIQNYTNGEVTAAHLRGVEVVENKTGAI